MAHLPRTSTPWQHHLACLLLTRCACTSGFRPCDESLSNEKDGMSQLLYPILWHKEKIRSLGTTPISRNTLSECEGHSRSSRRVLEYSRSSSRNSETDSRNAKFHSWNGISRPEQYEHHDSRSNSRSDSRNWREPKDFHLPLHSRSVFFKTWGGPCEPKKSSKKARKPT